MVKIITDSSTLYSQKEAKELGFRATPLSISIDDWEGVDLEMDMDRFYQKIKDGHFPKSSQPAIGLVMEAYEDFKEDEIVHITMADGLSGTYQSACGIQNIIENNENITVFNSRTLCGPHRYMVDQARKMAELNFSKNKILDWLNETSKHADSFLIPQDFGYLRRGGRLTPLAATFGGILRLKPIIKATSDGKRLDKFAVKRTISAAAEHVIRYLEKLNIDEKYIVYISHANVIKDALKVEELIKKAFPSVETEMFKLSPAFVTQGGPGCIAIQYIQKRDF